MHVESHQFFTIIFLYSNQLLNLSLWISVLLNNFHHWCAHDWSGNSPCQSGFEFELSEVTPKLTAGDRVIRTPFRFSPASTRTSTCTALISRESLEVLSAVLIVIHKDPSLVTRGSSSVGVNHGRLGFVDEVNCTKDSSIDDKGWPTRWRAVEAEAEGGVPGKQF